MVSFCELRTPQSNSKVYFKCLSTVQSMARDQTLLQQVAYEHWGGQTEANKRHKTEALSSEAVYEPQDKSCQHVVGPDPK